MSKCGLPNVDIFDPIKRVNEWNACATQQQINCFLKSEIDRTQKCLHSFIGAQKSINEAVDGKLTDHESRITSLEAAKTALAEQQSKLQQNFNTLRTDNAEFKVATSETIAQFNATVTALNTANTTISTNQQKLFLEIETIKSQIDPEKLDAAIAGYSAILDETKALIAANKEESDAELADLKALVNKTDADLRLAVEEYRNEQTKLYQNFTSNLVATTQAETKRLQAEITAQNDVIDGFKSDVNKSIDKVNANVDAVKGLVAEESDRLDGRIDTVGSKINTLDSNIQTETQLRENADSLLQANLDRLSATSKQAISDETDARVAGDKALSAEIADVVTQVKVNAGVATQANEAVTKRVSELELVVSTNKADSVKADTALQDQIDAIKVTEKDNLTAAKTYTDAKVGVVQEALDAEIAARKNADADLQTANQTLAQTVAKNHGESTQGIADANLRISNLSTKVENLDCSNKKEHAELAQAIKDEAAAREKADSDILGAIGDAEESSSAALKKEIADRADADGKLDVRVTALEKAEVADNAAVNAKIDQEIKDRSSGDANLQGQVDEINAAIGKSLSGISTGLDAANKDIGSLQTKVAAVEVDNVKQWEGINKLRKDVDTAENKVNVIIGKVDQILGDDGLGGVTGESLAKLQYQYVFTENVDLANGYGITIDSKHSKVTIPSNHHVINTYGTGSTYGIKGNVIQNYDSVKYSEFMVTQDNNLKGTGGVARIEIFNYSDSTSFVVVTTSDPNFDTKK